MAVELRHIRYVIAAADNGSFRRAAAVLGIRESAISRRIRDLEDEIGVALFIRHHSGVTLTQAGSQFVARARRALSQLSFAAKDVGGFGRGETGTVRIGIFSSLASGFLADLLEVYKRACPDVHLEFAEGAPAIHITAVQGHQIDIAFVTGCPVVEGCDVEHLWSERVFVVLPCGHQLAEQAELRWIDLRGYTFVVSETEHGPEIYDYLVRHLSELGRRPAIQRHAVHRDTLFQIVALGQGLTLTSEATTGMIARGIVYRPLAADELPFSAIWSRRNDNPALRRLLSAARDLSRRRNCCTTGVADVLDLKDGIAFSPVPRPWSDEAGRTETITRGPNEISTAE